MIAKSSVQFSKSSDSRSAEKEFERQLTCGARLLREQLHLRLKFCNLRLCLAQTANLAAVLAHDTFSYCRRCHMRRIVDMQNLAYRTTTASVAGLQDVFSPTNRAQLSVSCDSQGGRRIAHPEVLFTARVLRPYKELMSRSNHVLACVGNSSVLCPKLWCRVLVECWRL